ncbi:MAG: GntR family transcriptional regulator [Desulfitobacterium hafniense]|nr:GntR family transcriptional regulator [Desulfitobacterium hafniense]
MEQEFRTKSEKVYFILQDEIIKGIIPPGTKLVISKLAKRFEVSEIPVREALKILANEGYVVLTPHSGVIVSSLSEDDIRQIFEIRINLESLAARFAVEHLSNSHIKTLEQMVEKSKEFLTNLDLKGYIKHNHLFHEFIYQHSNNQRLFTMISELMDFTRRYPPFFNNIQDVNNSIHEHKEILQALTSRNADLVEKLIKDHITRAYHETIRLVKQAKS